MKRKAASAASFTLLLALLSLSLLTGLSPAPPSARLDATVQTDKAPEDVWLELFVEGVNITTPGLAPLRNAVLSIKYVKANEAVLTPDVDWNVTECRLYIIYDAGIGVVISVSYSGGYSLRETVEISGTVTLDGFPVTKGLIGIEVEAGTNVTLRTIPTGTGQMLPSDIEITSFYLTDTLDNPKNTFQRGEVVRFRIAVRNKAQSGTKDVLVAFNLYDSNNAVQGFAHSTAHNLTAGGTATLSSEVTIARWASVGNTQAHAVVFSDWPKFNGYPYAPETLVNLTIIESEYLSPPNNPIPEQPIENGTYTMLLSLPPDPVPGVYTVTVCAQYEGLYSEIRYTQFQVLDIPAPPRASFIAKPPMANPNATISFDATYSSAEGFRFPEDEITSYWWDFGDGENDTGSTTSHSYPQKGNYTVTLNVTDMEGYWNTTSRIVRVTEIHDVALISIQCVSQIYSNWLFTLNVKVKNQGTFTETFSVAAYYNSSLLGTAAVSNLLPQTERTVGVQWNTAGLPLYVYYVVRAEATLPTDVDPSDNTITYGTTRTKALGDTDGDRDVDIFDIVFVATLYGIDSNNLRWNVQADLSPNGRVDIFDVVALASNYGRKY